MSTHAPRPIRPLRRARRIMQSQGCFALAIASRTLAAGGAFCLLSSCASVPESPQSATLSSDARAPQNKKQIVETPREQEKIDAAKFLAGSDFPADALLIPAVASSSAMIETHRCDLSDARIEESSGLGASRRFAGCVWTHNDSGDKPRFFLVGTSGALCGKTRATVTLGGAQSSDWEDMAVSGTAKNAFIYAGDIGDNLKRRTNISMSRFAESTLPANLNITPRMSTHAGASRASATNAKMPNPKFQVAPEITVRAERMTLRYPDGAHDAETLLASPDGRLIIVTKDLKGSLVFITPRPWAANTTQTLERIGALHFASNSFFGRLATGGDISPDGTHLVLRTYIDAFEWKLPPKLFAREALSNATSNADSWKETKQLWQAVWRQAPRAWVLPVTRQGEAICYGLDARRLFTTSEKTPAPLIELTH